MLHVLLSFPKEVGSFQRKCTAAVFNFRQHNLLENWHRARMKRVTMSCTNESVQTETHCRYVSSSPAAPPSLWDTHNTGVHLLSCFFFPSRPSVAHAPPKLPSLLPAPFGTPPHNKRRLHTCLEEERRTRKGGTRGQANTHVSPFTLTHARRATRRCRDPFPSPPRHLKQPLPRRFEPPVCVQTIKTVILWPPRTFTRGERRREEEEEEQRLIAAFLLLTSRVFPTSLGGERAYRSGVCVYIGPKLALLSVGAYCFECLKTSKHSCLLFRAPIFKISNNMFVQNDWGLEIWSQEWKKFPCS